MSLAFLSSPFSLSGPAIVATPKVSPRMAVAMRKKVFTHKQSRQRRQSHRATPHTALAKPLRHTSRLLYSPSHHRGLTPPLPPALQSAKKDPLADEFAFGLPGGDNILGNFDPAGFLEGKSKGEVYRLREAELAHGRVGMLAATGFLVQERFHPLFSGDGGPAIDQIPQLPFWLWIVMTIGIGNAELYRIRVGWAKVDPKTGKAPSALRPDYYPGYLNFDPLNLAPGNEKDLRLMQERELSHGRLGMIAAAGFLAQEAVTGQTWGAYWGDASF